MKVGAGSAVLTPQKNMWMAGYASRDKPSEGKVHDLFAKALAFEDETGAIFVWVTSDILGLPRVVSQRIAEDALERFKIPRERLMLTSSHTHTGPVIRDNLIGMYDIGEDQAALIKEYTDALPGKVLDAVGQAIADLEPCKVSWEIGAAGFAVNRREYTLGGVINGRNPIGPVDHDVPTLKIERSDGSVKAVAFGYACHNTTLAINRFTGDYAGFAQAHIESNLPGTMALFSAGCGGDQNPLPRGTVEHAQKYGTELGEAVLSVLKSDMVEIQGPIRAVYEEIPLALSAPPTREDLEKQLEDPNKYIARRAKRLLETLDENGKLDTEYPYPIQIWRFEDTLQLTTLGGEVVVDYSRWLKYELGRDRQWVIAYANDVMAYIPTLRVLNEGGYEGESSMIYYGFYGKWAPPIEENILASVRRLTEAAKSE